MSLALALLAPVFIGRNRVEQAIRWVFLLNLAAVVSTLVAVSVLHGTDRRYVFELIVISIVWSTLIVAGPLVGAVFRRATVHS